MVNNGLSRPHRRGASADTPRLVCEKTEEFVFQEETDHFENRVVQMALFLRFQ